MTRSDTSKANHLATLQYRAVTAYREGEAHRWVAALVAKRIVGAYAYGATAGLANSLSVSVDRVQDLAKAGMIYCRLRPHYPDMPDIRRMLTVSHFASIGVLAIKYDLDNLYVYSALRTAADEGASVEAMRAATVGECSDDNDRWQELSKKAMKQVLALFNDYATPEPVRLAARRFLVEVEDATKNAQM